MKKLQFRSALILAGLSLAACGDKGATDGGGGEGNVNGRKIEREVVPDGRFKPKNLEASIDQLVEGIESSNTDDMALGVVLKELINFWRPVAVGANRALSELEVVGSVQGTTREDITVEEQVEEQLGYIQEQIDLGVDGLVLAPHGEDAIPYINELTEKGTPVVTIDSDVADTDRAIYIGTDNTQGGITGGESLVEALDGATGRVLVLGNTDPGWATGYDRTYSAADVLEQAGNTVEVLNSIWNPEDEVAQIVEAINDGEPVVGMLGVFANAHALATGALAAELDEMPKIVAFDYEPDTLSYMEDGIITATHVQRQYYMGYMSVYVIYSINAIGLDATKEALGDNLLNGYHLDTGLDVIRAEDLAEYNDFIDALGI